MAEAAAQGNLGDGSEANIQSWALALAFPDLGKKGKLRGIVGGMPSKTTSNDVAVFKDRDTSVMVDGFSNYQITDNIGITPSLIVITNPDHNDNNIIYVRVLQANFNFQPNLSLNLS